MLKPRSKGDHHLRKAYGGAYIVMSSKHLRSDLNYAWPNAEIAVMGPDGRGFYRLPQGDRSGGRPGGSAREKTRQYREELANPFVAASRGYLDDVIQPARAACA
jgi:acetyl-CoA carboxylase carboxyltransferase component